MEKSFAPIIDGNLDGPDGVFRLIQDYLMVLNIDQAEQVIAAVQAICKGRNGKAITTERDYFIRNQHRMAYPTLKALKLPLGSGANDACNSSGNQFAVEGALHILA